jgi:hypothetical protein
MSSNAEIPWRVMALMKQRIDHDIRHLEPSLMMKSGNVIRNIISASWKNNQFSIFFQLGLKKPQISPSQNDTELYEVNILLATNNQTSSKWFSTRIGPSSHRKSNPTQMNSVTPTSTLRLN